MRKTSMRTRLNRSYLAISLIVVIVFSAVFYVYTSRILIGQETDRLNTLTESIRQRTDDAVRDMDDVSVDLVYISRTQRKLENTINEAMPTQGTDSVAVWQRYQALAELANLFVAVNGTNLPVFRVNLYDMAGNCVSVGATSVVKSGIDLKNQTWYAPALAADGYKTLTHAYVSTTLGSTASRPQYYLSLVRLRRGKSREPLGFVETVQNCSIIFQSVLALKGQDENIYVLDADGQLVYPFDGDAQTLSHAQALRDGAVEGTVAYPIASDYTGWTYIVERSAHAVLQPARMLLTMILGLSLVMVAVIALFAALASRRFSRPLLALSHRMNATDVHSLENEEQDILGGYREIDSLNDSFQQMRRQLNASLNQLIATKQQALQSRNLAMQAQINPHFYYNTLSSIIALTDAGRPDDVNAMCRSLTGMMRYITRSEPMTTLREELKYVTQYLYCMQIRYENNFTYSIDVPESLLDEPVPRLIIQPFVENALKYGIDCAPPWKLQIVGEVVPDCWRVWIIDNGPGFSKKALKEIREGMVALDRSPEMPESQIGGMGVLNVYARWKLFAGSDALFEIRSRATGSFTMIGRERRASLSASPSLKS